MTQVLFILSGHGDLYRETKKVIPNLCPQGTEPSVTTVSAQDALEAYCDNNGYDLVVVAMQNSPGKPSATQSAATRDFIDGLAQIMPVIAVYDGSEEGLRTMVRLFGRLRRLFVMTTSQLRQKDKTCIIRQQVAKAVQMRASICVVNGAVVKKSSEPKILAFPNANGSLR